MTSTEFASIADARAAVGGLANPRNARQVAILVARLSYLRWVVRARPYEAGPDIRRDEADAMQDLLEQVYGAAEVEGWIRRADGFRAVRASEEETSV